MPTSRPRRTPPTGQRKFAKQIGISEQTLVDFMAHHWITGAQRSEMLRLFDRLTTAQQRQLVSVLRSACRAVTP